MLAKVGNILCGNNEDLPEYFTPNVVVNMKFTQGQLRYDRNVRRHWAPKSEGRMRGVEIITQFD
jgi:hypothetical protein